MSSFLARYPKGPTARVINSSSSKIEPRGGHEAKRGGINEPCVVVTVNGDRLGDFLVQKTTSHCPAAAIGRMQEISTFASDDLVLVGGTCSSGGLDSGNKDKDEDDDDTLTWASRGGQGGSIVSNDSDFTATSDFGDLDAVAVDCTVAARGGGDHVLSGANAFHFSCAVNEVQAGDDSAQIMQRIYQLENQVKAIQSELKKQKEDTSKDKSCAWTVVDPNEIEFEALLLAKSDEERCPVHAAVQYGYMEDIYASLDETKFDGDATNALPMNRLDSSGRTALDFAAMTGQVRVVQLLLSKDGHFCQFDGKAALLAYARARASSASAYLAYSRSKIPDSFAFK